MTKKLNETKLTIALTIIVLLNILIVDISASLILSNEEINEKEEKLTDVTINPEFSTQAELGSPTNPVIIGQTDIKTDETTVKQFKEELEELETRERNTRVTSSSKKKSSSSSSSGNSDTTSNSDSNTQAIDSTPEQTVPTNPDSNNTDNEDTETKTQTLNDIFSQKTRGSKYAAPTIPN